MDPSFISSTRRLAIFLSCSLIFSSPLFGKCYGAPENYTASTVNDGDVGSYVVAVSSLLPEECACNNTNMMMKGNDDDELELVHTDNPCTKHGGGAGQQKAGATHHHSIIASTFSRDQSRINWLLSAPNVGRTQLSSSYADRAFGFSQAATLRTTHWQPPTHRNLYIVKIRLGSPPQSLSVMIDTGSQILWTQCEPCSRYCYPQREHIFDPKTSTTYTNFTCHSRACRELNATVDTAGCFENTNCIYAITYSDSDTYSVGYWAEDTLTLTPSAVFKNIRFGCGQRNSLTGNASFAGILGLSRDSVSVVSQTADTYDQVFSYCIPSKPCFSGFLKFGRSCVTPATKFTPLKKNPPNQSFYFIELTGISVAGKKIRVNRSVLTTSHTLIDSGTTFTYLPSMAYAALRASFREEMKHYPLLPSATKDSLLDTCYDLSNRGTVRVPSITLFFAGGVVVSIPPSGILLASSDTDTGKKMGCLAFVELKNFTNRPVTIIGATQQQTHAVIYDVGRGRIGFGPKACH